MVDKTQFLKKISFFQSIDKKDLDAVSEIMRERFLKKGSILFSQGEAGESIFFVVKGKVKIYKTSEDGKEHTLTLAGEGDLFAEVVLFNEVNYPASAEAIEETTILYIRNSDMEKVLFNNPKLSIVIIKALNKRLIDSQTQVERLAFQDSQSRTAQILLELSKSHGEETVSGVKIDLGLTRQELANMVGVTRETFTRILSLLKKQKIIEITGQEITIKDIHKLERRI